MIQIDKITKRYNEKIIFDNLTMNFENGKFYALMGNSGYGKTTLVSIIAGLVKQDSGIVNVQGKISFVFQENRLLTHLTALENLDIVSKDKAKNLEILKSLGLENDIHTLISKLSGGMKRRVAIARALVFEHDILILDEPFKGLDQQLLEQTIQLVKVCEQSKTLILITHIQEEAVKLGCEIIKLN